MAAENPPEDYPGRGEQPAYYSDRIDPVTRSGPHELFLITIEAVPEPESEDYGEAGGAFVNCWINADTLRTAERLATKLIRENDWRPHRFEAWEIVTRDTYAVEEPGEDEPDLRELVEQAFVDGEACVFNTWPVDAPDAEEE
jgi:hypothetical protein